MSSPLSQILNAEWKSFRIRCSVAVFSSPAACLTEPDCTGHLNRTEVISELCMAHPDIYAANIKLIYEETLLRLKNTIASGKKNVLHEFASKLYFFFISSKIK